MSKYLKSLLLTAASLLVSMASTAQAFYSPISVSIVPPLQFPPSDFSVTGARVSAIYGQQRDVYGIDLGLIGNVTEQDFVGIGVSGIFNHTRGQTTVLGLQAAGVTNVNIQKTSVYGVQLSLLNINSASSMVAGVQAGLLANISGFTDVYGAQIGLYNHAQSIRGLQIGLINVAKNLYGVQIGLLNFHHQGVFAVSPIINVGF